MSVAENFTDFSSGSRFVFQMAVDEYHTGRNWSGLVDRYWLIVEELIADPRAKHLPFMDNPLPTLGLIVCYLLWVLKLGPMYMRDRKPMDLRRIIIYYNLFQVLLSGYMFYEHLMAGWLQGYSFTCQTVDYNDGPLSRRMFNLCYVYYLSKLTEFADTTFFVLRKKQSQITDLHVYHHSLTPIEAWILTKFIAGGNATFPNIINNFVHVLMYFYYMLSAMGPRYQKYLWWKKYMTEVQIIQFILCIGHCINALVTGCPFPRFISTLLLINASIFLALFMNFYIQSYNRRPSAKSATVASGAASVPAIVDAASVEQSSKVQDLLDSETSERPKAQEVNNNSIESIEPLVDKPDRVLPPTANGDIVSKLDEQFEGSDENVLLLAADAAVTTTELPKDVIATVEGLRQRILSPDELRLADPPVRESDVFVAE
ncbi:elongation of very long chain fatty acids protein 7-like isoform X2 [Topomyia yanbarensis]|uniref:elongation of very long chain fatty acids protein 7-like isoform X2 n=1 Tax=Topomyia yanbarensis TaxID=2498891 RepID=UPI00273CA547|nr:elongation of very long chain fatty acids protein 7-like isoform X2 [Topomyia yanbarensis]